MGTLVRRSCSSVCTAPPRASSPPSTSTASPPRGLGARAASAGMEPDDAIPPRVAQGLRDDGVETVTRPRRPMSATSTVRRSSSPSAATWASWPPARRGSTAGTTCPRSARTSSARDVIVAHVTGLLEDPAISRPSGRIASASSGRCGRISAGGGPAVLGSVAGIIMNTAVVLPAILLGRAIDRALALARGETTAADVGWAALAFVAATLLTELPRASRNAGGLMTANARIRANVWATRRVGVADGGRAADAGGRSDGLDRRRRRGPRRRRPRVHHRDLGHRALLPVLRGGDARLRPGSHAPALTRAAGHDPRSRHRPLGRPANDAGARGERRPHRGHPGASRRHQCCSSAAPARRSSASPAVGPVRGEEPEPRPTQGGPAAGLHDDDGRRRRPDRLARQRARRRRRDDGRRVRRLPRAVPALRQPRSSHPAARELDAEWGRRYARLRPLLAPALGVEDEGRFASFRAGHVAGSAGPTPAGRGRQQARSPCSSAT